MTDRVEAMRAAAVAAETQRLVNRAPDPEAARFVGNLEQRVVIDWTPDDDPLCLFQAARGLREKNVQLYMRSESGAKLFRLSRESVPLNDAEGNLIEASRPTLSQLTSDMADVVLSRNFRFTKEVQVGRRTEQRACTPPSTMSKALALAEPEGFWPVLDGMWACQFMREDGSIACERGYDKQTQMLLYSLPDLEPLPKVVSRKDALAAAHRLTECFRSWDFEKEHHKGAALAYAATFVLYAGGFAPPIFCISAPKSGAGKSYLVRVVSYLGTGRDAGFLNYDGGSEEFQKRWDIETMSGAPQKNIDNVNGRFGGAFMETNITSRYVEPRILGKSEKVAVKNVSVKTVNGNNIRPTADMVRRCVYIRMKAKFENAQTRTFDFDPLQYMRRERGSVIRDILIIGMAYRQHLASGGARQKVTPVSDFDEWARRVVEPLVWAGIADPMTGGKELVADDPAGESVERLLWALRDAIEAGLLNNPFKADELEKIYGSRGWIDAPVPDERQPSQKQADDEWNSLVPLRKEIRDALDNRMPNAKRMTAILIGTILANVRDVPVFERDDAGAAQSFMLVRNEPVKGVRRAAATWSMMLDDKLLSIF